jgi:aminopeptidase
MTDPRLGKLADLLVNYSVAVQPKQKVAIRGSTLAAPLIREVYRAVLQAGGYPFVLPSIPGLDEIRYKLASDDQLAFIPEPVKVVEETFDAQIYLKAADNTKSLTSIDPARMVVERQAQKGLFKTFLARSAKGDMKWTLTLFPTPAYAQDAEMSLSEYEDFVFQACMPDMNDPVSYWKGVAARQEKIVEWLNGKHRVHVTGPETDLHLDVSGRKFISCACQANVPDGEIFTGPVEDSVEGHVFFSYPAIYSGREVTGVRLWFEKGKVVKVSADKNEDVLLKTLDTDRGARYVGEFAIGTNEGITRFTREILFDEKIGGSFHMAVGSGYPETGSTNESAVHWDMICDLRQGGEIRVDGELLYQNGKFALGF